MIRIAILLLLSACTYLQTDATALCGVDAPPADAPRPVDAPPTARKIIVIAGQSNAYGQGDAVAIPPAIAATYPGVRLVASIGFDSTWHLLLNHDGALQPRSDGKFGVELTLGRALPQYDIVQVGINGSSLWYGWKPTGPWPITPNLYNQTIAFAKAAIPPGGSVVAFVWIQGESDAGNQTWAQAYQAELTDLSSRVRTAFPGALFVYDRLSSQTTFAYKTIIRAGQEAAASGPGMRMVNVDDIGISGHFTSQGLLDLGNRLATTINTP